ncbi:asparagine synthase (glutamine-hydrolyzing) [Alkalihalobacterium chitinilyticum]|uniref:asparagine synthase (glutamine-hydrolyzing) n=1 Tax=Alkalihalobacterium chitinilyticum TaxID=2980103 RepID=A0ABT5V9J3_9BACI|nr:asparagine synthase (glutamine-hydrolyzing) [Alkalihalobacterium chitinilyticum]MDE5412133.1 asparagine synthase (glutamine-hydrolyzing) [Alkalihalobacterium chitinilyticum]
MCGITGWIDWKQNMVKEQAEVEKMAKTLSRRGPDDINIWSSNHAALGHTRLIVVDPEGGIQPMTRTKGNRSYTIVYNGELYNTEDLRKELLQRGHTFKGHSDTEVLLTSYIEWGFHCLEKLNGIFAFAIWSEHDQSLILARDRLGVKPLFYSVQNGKLLFASEIKALLAHRDISTTVDETGLSEVLGLGPSRTPGHGVFADIEELRPAHAMLYDRNGAKITRYWKLKSKEHVDNVDETAEKVRWLLTDTVERQLVADVPVCTFLSGGIDSSALTALAANVFERDNKGDLRTYSIDYADNDKYFKANDFQPNADGPWIEKVSNEFRTLHTNHVISMKDLAGYLKKAVEVRDLPGMADIDSSLLWFCEKIKEDVTVGLSGECADEIFGGYPWFHKPEVMNLDGFPWMRSTQEREALLQDKWKNKLKLQSYVHERYKETIAETPRFEEDTKEEARRREISYLNIIWFMTTLLDRKDRMSMGASLEVRVPFADHRLVEYVWNIPWEMKQLNGLEKGILRKALEGILPDEVLYRKKSPYPKTHNPHYTNAVKTEMLDILSQNDSPLFDLIDRTKMREIAESGGASFKTPWFGQLMTGPQLIAHFIQMDHWLKHYNVQIKG